MCLIFGWKIINMSTKIYNGYTSKLMTLPELQDLLINFGEKAKEKRIELINKAISTTAEWLADRIVIGEYTLKDLDNFFIEDECRILFGRKDIKILRDCISNTTYQVQKREESKTRKAYDYSFSISFRAMDNKMLYMLHCVNSELIELWEKTDGISEYMYYNNIDKPESLTDEQWDERRDDWDKCIPKYVPALTMMSFAPPGEDCTFSYRKFKYIPNCKEKRVSFLTRELLKKYHARKVYVKKVDEDDNGKEFGYMEPYREWVGTENYKNVKSHIIETLNIFLPETYTVEQLDVVINKEPTHKVFDF